LLAGKERNPTFAGHKKAEGVGIEPTGDNAIAPRTALKAGTATRRHPLPPVVYNNTALMANTDTTTNVISLVGQMWISVTHITSAAHENPVCR